MHIKDAVEEFHKDLDEWLDDYVQKNQNNGEDWPLSGFSKSEWFEDFEAWKENNDK